MRKLYLVLAVLIPASCFADHLLGGEITWKCLSSGPDAGKFVFQMIIYRDCNGASMSCCGPYNLNSNSPAGTIPMHDVDTNELSPVCNPSPLEPHVSCATATGTDTGAVQEYIYQSNPVVINGVPPAGGWTFYWETCCRQLNIANLTGPGMRLRAKMYPSTAQNAFPCFDSSPLFLEKPNPVYCARYSSQMNPNAWDPDGDSVSIEWSDAQQTGGIACGYGSGYSYDNPLPDTTEDTLNIGAQLHPNGQIDFTSYTNGSFVVCLKASSWKCGQLVAEIFRDVEMIIKGCRPLIPNSPPPILNYGPLVTPPFIDSLGQFSYSSTVLAGDTVDFYIAMTDFDLDPGGNMQTLHLKAAGAQFSMDFTNTDSCLHPPCATLSPNPNTTSGFGILNFSFNWITNCDHLQAGPGCGYSSMVHNFVFKALDDFCPIPGLNLFTVSVTVLPPPGMAPQLLLYNSGNTLYSSVSTGTFQWYRNDTVIAGAIGNYYVPADTGWYSAELLLAGGCSNRSAAFYFAPVATKDMTFDLDILLSPNPFYQTVKLSAQSRKAIRADATLWNAFGQRISSWSYSQSSNRLEEEIDLSPLPSGVYFLEFYSGGVRKTFQLVRMEAAH